MSVVVRAATDQGLKRAHNEDHLGTWIPDDARQNGRGILLVVADGMGGSLAGEVASQLAVDCVLREYQDGEDSILEDLRRAVESANQIVHDQSVAYPDLRGMGTTCTAVVLRGPEAYLAHVGDSRAYLVRKGSIRQLTQDHSLVAQLVQHRQLTAEQAKSDPRSNVVTRSVGVGAAVEVDAERVKDPLVMGDTVLLCTDGLHGLVRDEEIAAAASQSDLEKACHELIDLAKERGGHDNITVVIARLGD